MIGYLHGHPVQVDTETAILDVNGVGYQVHCSAPTLAELGPEKMEQLWIYTHVREDSFVLYGFRQMAEKELFLSLLKVNGIGPKLAIKVLSAARIESLVEMIDDGDVKGLTALPKIGKKTAEQIILSLKGKLVLADSGASTRFPARNQIVSALVNLGFKVNDVEKVVAEMNPSLEVQDGVRDGLTKLSHI